MRTFFGYIIILLFIPIFSGLFFLTVSESKEVQSFNNIIDEKIAISPINLKQSSYILDKNDNVITNLYKEENRTSLEFDDIPEFLIDLFIITEDRHFYNHVGFDIAAIGRAFSANMKSNSLEQGASTITQQLARGQYLTFDKTYNRKLSELLHAYALERAYKKDELLQLYINSIYFQNGNYGIEAAAQYYFQLAAKDLTKAQLAFLAAIPNNPTLYDPLTNFENTKKRQERLLDQMADADILSNKEVKRLKKENISLNVAKKRDDFHDYTSYVIAEFKRLIASQEGFDDRLKKTSKKSRAKIEEQLDDRVNEVLNSGIVIHTSLDPDLQKKSVQAVQRHLQYENIEGSAAVIDNDKLEIVALVGGKNYKKHDFNRAYQAFRQPGSAIKPLIAYAPYFERTNASTSRIINANNFCIGKYCPKNYGGGQYGNVTLERAFINSYNTPAVRLLKEVGIENAFKDMEPFQFSHVSKSDHNYPAAIGGFTYGMSPLELTSAFTVFANKGFYQHPRAIKKVTNINGAKLYEWKDENIKVWSNSTIEKTRYLLNKTVTSGTARKANFNKEYIGGKTGTSNDYKDLWFVGLTDELTAGVWVGKDRNGDVHHVNKISPHLLIWRDIVK